MNKILIILFLLIYNLFLFTAPSFSEDNKIKIGLLVPLTGENSEIGKQIVQATRLALSDINSDKIEIFPKDTNSDPNKTLRSAIELESTWYKFNYWSSIL
jgi:outer membrane PBP1 activator LpoA protein